MSESKQQSDRRQHEISVFQEMTTDENIQKWLTRRHTNHIEKSAEVLAKCVRILISFVNANTMDYEKLYQQYALHRKHLTSEEYLMLVTDTEDILRKRLHISRLESKEREYHQQQEHIEFMGYKSNKKYLITYPETPTREDEVWIVTEFHIEQYNLIVPDKGRKIKKNGEPYINECLINIGYNQKFTLLLL